MTADGDRIWAWGARSAVWLGATAAAASLGVCLRIHALSPSYFWQNRLPDPVRLGILGWALGAGVVAFAGAVAWLLIRRRDAASPDRLDWFARRTAPVGPLCFAPVLFDWRLFRDYDFTFLALVLLDALAVSGTVAAYFRAGPSPLEERLFSLLRLEERLGRVGRVLQRPQVATLLVVVSSLAYVFWFSYHTVVWHRQVRSGYDLAIEDSILWNLLRGEFFHAAPTLGPAGSHFGRHATLVSYLFLPFYAVHQSAETLLVVQTALMGFAAVPLFLFARGHVGSWPADFLAGAYLMHPAVQESNLFEVHYVKFGTLFFWAALFLWDTRRYRSALFFAALTLTVREDVATWVILLGLWALFSGRAPRLGAALTAASAVYVGLVKFVVMPRFRGGGDDLLFMYTGLLPDGHQSFAWVLASVIGNPAYALGNLLEPGKLVFLLQILVPMVLLPLRRAVGWFALLPGFLYCLLGTNYPSLVDIHYQYSPHLLAFLFPALALVLAGRPRSAATGAMDASWRKGALAAVAIATLACSYQYGSVLQTHTSRGGPIPYKFGWDAEGRERHRAIRALLGVVPSRARVAASAFTVPQFSARPNGYSLSLGLYDADWIVAPTRLSEYVPSEIPTTRHALGSGDWGVVAVEGPFFAARRGHDPARNAEVLGRIGR